MNRRVFSKKSLIASTALILGASSSNAFSEILAKQNFDFMHKEHPNTILIHDFFTAYSNNDLKSIKKVLAKDIKWHIPGAHPLSGTKNGINEVLDFLKKINYWKI